MLDGVRSRMRMVAAAATETPKKVIGSLLSGQLSKPKETWLGAMFNESYNPDRQIADYRRMLDYDAQIKAGMDVITYTLLSKKLIITPAAEDLDTSQELDITLNEPRPGPEDTLNQEVADFLEDMLGNMQTTLRRVRKDIYTAIPYGFSVSEIIFRYDEENNRIVWEDVKSIDIDTLDRAFQYDELGNIKTIKQDWGGVGDPPEIPPEKCIIYSFDEEFGNKYGRSMLKQVYDHWFMKRKVLKWYNIFLQKIQNPVFWGKTMNPNDQTKLLDSLDKIEEGRTNLVVNKEDELGILETALKGEGFLGAITYHDNMIFRRFMIGSLLLGQADASGSYAQSQTHKEVFAMVMDGIHEDIAAIFQRKLKELVDMNFDVDVYPAVSFESITEKDVLRLLEVLQPYFSNMSLLSGSKWFENMIKEAVELYTNVDVDFDETNVTPPTTSEPETAKTPVEEPEEIAARSHDDKHIVSHVKEYLRNQGLMRGLKP